MSDETEDRESSKGVGVMQDGNDRIRLLRVEERLMLDIIRGLDGWEHLSLPDFTGIPEDARVLAVNHIPEDRCFLFRIHSTSFDAVTNGGRIPLLESTLRRRHVTVKKIAIDV